MKRILQAAVITMAVSATGLAQDLAGDWTGTLHANQDLRLVLHVEAAGPSEWEATFASVDQGGKAVPVDSFWVRGTDVIFTVRPFGGSFQGKIDSEGKLTGYWLQGASLPLTFTHKP